MVVARRPSALGAMLLSTLVIMSAMVLLLVALKPGRCGSRPAALGRVALPPTCRCHHLPAVGTSYLLTPTPICPAGWPPWDPLQPLLDCAGPGVKDAVLAKPSLSHTTGQVGCPWSVADSACGQWHSMHAYSPQPLLPLLCWTSGRLPPGTMPMEHPSRATFNRVQVW